MEAARLEQTSVDIKANDAIFARPARS